MLQDGRGVAFRLTAPPAQKPPPAPAWHAPEVAPSAPHAPAVFTGLPAQPFQHAERQAQQRVQQTHAAVIHQWTPEARRQNTIDERAAHAPKLEQQNTLLGHLLRSSAEESRRQVAVARAVQAFRQHQERERSQGPSLTPFGLVNIGPVVHALATVKVPGLGGVPGKIVNEALDLPGQTFLTGAQAGGALHNALLGKPEQLEGLGKSIFQQATHPVESFKQAPLSTALLLGGMEDAAGRALGGVGRALPSDALKSVLSRDRPSLRLYGENPDGTPVAKDQQYNPDPARKAAQVAYEKALTKLPGSLRQRDPFVAEGWRLNRELVGGRVKPGRLDREVAAQEQARRQLVKNKVVPEGAKAGRQVRSGVAGRLAGQGTGLRSIMGTKPIIGQDAVPLIYDATIRTPATVGADLAKRAGVLKAAQADLRGADLQANRAQLAQVEGLRNDKAFMADPSEAFAAAQRLKQLQNPLVALRLHHGGLTAEQTRARLFPYAIEHMGARHFTEADHLAAEHAAAMAEQEAAARAQQLEPGSPEHAHAVQEAAAARAQRWEVSGRGAPEVQAAHEQSVQAHQQAAQQVTQAFDHVARAEDARSRLVGQNQARPRGARPESRLTAQEKAAQAGGGTAMAAADARVAGAKEALRAAKAREVELREGVAAQPPVEAALRTAEGKHLSDAAIEAHMRANGVDPQRVGFVSHQPGRTSRGSFYKALVTRLPATERFRRTGAAYAKGTHDSSYAGLVGHLADEASKVAQHEAHMNFIRRYGIGEYDRPNADLAAKNFNHPEAALPGAREGQQLGGMRVVSKGSGQIIDAGHLETPPNVSHELARLGISEYAPSSSVEHGKYTLVPEDVFRRIEAHQQASTARTDLRRFAQGYTQAFRHVKFALSPKHFAGVVEENLIRPVVEHAGPLSYVSGRQFQKALAEHAQTNSHGFLNDAFGPEGTQARHLQGLLGGRGLVTATKAADIVRKPDALAEQGLLSRGAEKAGRSAPVRAWINFRNMTEGTLRGFEHVSQTAQLGRVLQKQGFLPAFKGAATLVNKGMQEHIDGKLTANKADQIARALDNAAGNWNHLTPGVRNVVSTYSPFGLWWLNSTRWLAHLPIEHPLKTGVIAGLYHATAQQRNAEGQGSGATGLGTKEHPNYLQGTIPTTLPGLGAVRLDLGHYSPIGVAGPEAPNTAAEQFLPQFSGVFAGAEGSNPLTHEKATQQNGAELTGTQKALNALSELVAGPTAGATQVQQALQGGGKPYGTANLFSDIASKLGGPPQVKPGSGTPASQTLLKLLSPLRTYKARGAAGPAQPTGSAAARALSRSSSTPAFDEARIKRAIEASERAAARVK